MKFAVFDLSTSSSSTDFGVKTSWPFPKLSFKEQLAYSGNSSLQNFPQNCHSTSQPHLACLILRNYIKNRWGFWGKSCICWELAHFYHQSGFVFACARCADGGIPRFSVANEKYGLSNKAKSGLSYSFQRNRFIDGSCFYGFFRHPENHA